jgi:LmbE family N-acetylglucosaminyl deacetylase
MTTAGQVLRRLEALPFGELANIVGAGCPMVLAPHPDDESIGCGGLIAACCERGTPPVVMVVTDGAKSHPGSRTHPAEKLRAVRESEARAAVSLLGARGEDVVFMRIDDTRSPLDGPLFESAVETIAQLARSARCSVILAPWRHDPHCDHESVDAMARAAAVRIGATHLSYPVWGWTLPEATPLPDETIDGWRLDISAHRDVKARAIAAHESQYGDLITDDPNGFRLPANLLAFSARSFEVFVSP